MFEAALKELGLTENETHLYLYLLGKGTTSPAIVAQKLGLHRAYTYDTLERLREKQIVIGVREKGKQHYRAARPEMLAELLKARYESFQDIVPKLAKLAQQDTGAIQVDVHHGPRVYRTLLLDIAKTARNDEVLIIGIDEDIIEDVEPIYLKQYLNAMKDRNIRERILVHSGVRKVTHARVTYREIDSTYVGDTVTEVYGNHVAIFTAGNPHTLIIITSNAIADSYRKQFELLWKVAKTR